MKEKEISKLEKKQREFISNEILPDKEFQKKRFINLQLAMYLWNGVYEKTKIVFKEKGIVKSIETPVWFVSEKYVRVSAGMTILVSCILDVII